VLSETNVMNATQENKLSMYLAVQVVLEQNQDIWQAVPAFGTAFTGFKSGINNINTLVRARNASTKGVTADKQAARDAMTRAALEVAGAVAAYAVDIGSGELQAKVDYSDSDLRRARDSEVATICLGIVAAASDHQVALAGFGVTSEKLASLKEKIEAYNATVGKPRSARSHNQAAGASLETEFAEADKLLSGKLDNLMVAFRASQPAFYSAYEAARWIVCNRAGHKSKNGGTGNEADAPAQPPVPPQPHTETEPELQSQQA